MSRRRQDHRIASLLAGSTEILCGIGAAKRIVGISHECDWPTEILDRPRLTRSCIDDSQSSSQIDTQVKTMMRDHNALYQIDTARLRELKPDVIVTQAQCDVCAVSYADVVRVVAESEQLVNTRIVAMNPMTLDDVFRDIHAIGDAIGAKAEASAYVERLHQRLANISDHVAANAAPHPRVVCIEWIEPLMIAANWIPDLIRAAGGLCELTESGKKSTHTDWQTIIDHDPDVIVVSPCGFDLPRTMSEAKSLQSLPGWRSLSAVRNNRVFAIDGNAYFNRSGPRLVDSVELLANVIWGFKTDELAGAFSSAFKSLTVDF